MCGRGFIGWVELLSGYRKQHQCCVRGWVSYIDIQKTGTSLPLPLTFLLFQWCSLRFQDQDDQKCVGGLGGWSCCHVDSSSGAILRPCYRASGCNEGKSRWWPGERWLLRQLKHSRRWAEGRMKGCGRFKLLDRARRYGHGRYGDWPGGSSCECNRNNMKSLKTKAA